MTTASLTRTAARGLGWSWVGIVATTLMQLVYTAVMSRLIEPGSFGIVASALIGLRFIVYFSRFGLGSAVVQRASLSDYEVRVAVGLSIGFGIISAVIAVLASPLLARVVREPDAAAVMRWLSLGLLAGALTAIPEALLRRRMQFGALATCQIVSFAIGYLAVGVTLAVRGWGVWSLVAASLSQAGVYLVLTSLLARLPLRPRFGFAAARDMLSFGATVMVTGFIEFLSASVDTLAVGRWLGAASLGQYSRASFLVGLPVEQASSAASRVLLPTFSTVQHDSARFVRGYTMSAGALACVVTIPVAMISVAAPALVPFILGPGWLEAASLLPIVGCAQGLGLLTNLPAVAAESKGAVGRKLVVQSVSLIATIVFVGAVAVSGPRLDRFALAWLAGELVRHLLFLGWMLPSIGISRHVVGRRYLAAVLLSVAASLPLFILVRVLEADGFLVLASGASLGLVCAVSALALPTSSVLRADFVQLRGSI